MIWIRPLHEMQFYVFSPLLSIADAKTKLGPGAAGVPLVLTLFARAACRCVRLPYVQRATARVLRHDLHQSVHAHGAVPARYVPGIPVLPVGHKQQQGAGEDRSQIHTAHDCADGRCVSGAGRQHRWQQRRGQCRQQQPVRRRLG